MSETIEILHRYSRTVLWSGPAESIKDALRKAVSARADLADANLARANLAGADLADANLARADLAGAYLAGAYLADANLAGADLADANLARADLADANLARANLAGADLAGVNLAGAYLADAKNYALGIVSEAPAEPYVRKTRQERMLEFRARYPDVPVVEHLDARILAAIEGPGAIGSLNMATWHACGTTHCRGGWAIHLAGPAGYELERAMGNDPQRAATAIYRASTGRVPHFFASNERALEDIRKRAAEST